MDESVWEFPLRWKASSATQRFTGKMNGGGEQLTIHTGDGSIRLNRT